MDTTEIYNQLRDFLVDTFEIDAEIITADADLFEDLDLDSIDAVDLIVQLREITGIKINQEDFKSVHTVQDVLDTVGKLLSD
jgi:acyl carrier protein